MLSTRKSLQVYIGSLTVRVEMIYHSNSNQSKGVTILIYSKINFIIDKLETAKNFIYHKVSIQQEDPAVQMCTHQTTQLQNTRDKNRIERSIQICNYA